VIWMHSSGAQAWLGDAILLAQIGRVSLIVNATGSGMNGSAEGDRDATIAAVVALRHARRRRHGRGLPPSTARGSRPSPSALWDAMKQGINLIDDEIIRRG